MSQLSRISFVSLMLAAGCGGGGNDGSDRPDAPAATGDATAATGDGAATSADAPAAAACTVPDIQITHTGGPAATSFQYVQLDHATYPTAVCNDGSTAAYQIRPGVGAAASRWVIYMEGGSECYDQQSCATRANATGQFPSGYTTSNYYRDHPSELPEGGGLMSSDPSVNPDFYDATIVYMLYCSSDDWSGAKAGSGTFDKSDPSTWSFQGHAIARSVVADLMANHGLRSAKEVMLTGSSAGGVGVFANTNDLAEALPAGVRFLAFSDAAYANHNQDFSESAAAPNYTVSGTSNQIAKRELGLPLWNGTGDKVCAASATDVMSQIDCYDAQTLLGTAVTITLPMLVAISQTDDAQLTSSGVTTGSIDAKEAAFVSYFSSLLRASFPVVNSNVSVFSPDLPTPYVHTEEDLDSVFPQVDTFPGGNTSLQAVVGAWYRSPCSAKRTIAN